MTVISLLMGIIIDMHLSRINDENGDVTRGEAERSVRETMEIEFTLEAVEMDQSVHWTQSEKRTTLY